MSSPNTKLELIKSSFLQAHLAKLKELSRWQSDYHKLLFAKESRRRDSISKTGLQKYNAKLRHERNILKSCVWTANGAVHRQTNNRQIKNIKCHIDCEEHLSDDIHRYKADISILSREINRISKQIYELTKKTIPATRAVEHNKKVVNLTTMLENQLEVGIHCECRITAENAVLRRELLEELEKRNNFNEYYTKLIETLNGDRKYLVDLIEFAMLQFDLCIKLYDKQILHDRRESKETDQQKAEMNDIVRSIAAANDVGNCVNVKHKIRPLLAVSDRETKRRNNLCDYRKKRIDLCRSILRKMYQYTNSRNVAAVIRKFQEQESLYYSYFNYANETSYHMTILNNAVNILFNKIDGMKKHNRDSLQAQLDVIDRLEKALLEKRKNNRDLKKVFDTNNAGIKVLLTGFDNIRNQMRTDWSPLQLKLGDFSHVNLMNMRDQLKLIERRIFSVLTAVYMNERRSPFKPNFEPVVRGTEKICEWPTGLSDIVPTQQCPECAEVDALNLDDTENVAVQPTEIVRKKICDKVVQPEMQYLLHSISMCRFPRARMLMQQRQMDRS